MEKVRNLALEARKRVIKKRKLRLELVKAGFTLQEANAIIKSSTI